MIFRSVNPVMHVPAGTPLEKNPYIVWAMEEYMFARKLVKQGMKGNAGTERDMLRDMYRVWANKAR